MTKFYSVYIKGRKRKTRFQGSRKIVYKKLHKLGYEYNRYLKKWEFKLDISFLEAILPKITTTKKLKQVAIYGYVINNMNNYSFAEISFYTDYDIRLDEVFKVIESLKLKIIRAGLNNRIDITERKVDNYNGKTLHNYLEINNYITDYINGIKFIPRQNKGYKHSQSVINETDAERLRKAFFEK